MAYFLEGLSCTVSCTLGTFGQVSNLQCTACSSRCESCFGATFTECHNCTSFAGTDYFLQYAKKYTDSPYLVEITTDTNGVIRPGQLLRAGRLDKYSGEENGEWKFLMWDEATQGPKMP